MSEMAAYLEAFVEAPHDLFGGLPVCPFAKKYRKEGQIQWIVGELSLQLMASTPHNHLMTVFVDPRKDLSLEELYETKAKAEAAFPEYDFFTGHPQSQFCIGGLYTRREPYPNIQRVLATDVEMFERKLAATRWYDQLTETEIKDKLRLSEENVDLVLNRREH